MKIGLKTFIGTIVTTILVLPKLMTTYEQLWVYAQLLRAHHIPLLSGISSVQIDAVLTIDLLDISFHNNMLMTTCFWIDISYISYLLDCGQSYWMQCRLIEIMLVVVPVFPSRVIYTPPSPLLLKGCMMMIFSNIFIKYLWIILSLEHHRSYISLYYLLSRDLFVYFAYIICLR